MSVKLISYTKPVDETLATNLLELTAYIARVSNPSNQHNKETSEKLINYCIKHKHWSVFEHCYATLEINTTRDIGRQILRHQAKFQEFSQRYSDPVENLGFITREARLQDVKNRQNSIDTDDQALQDEWERLQKTIIEACSTAYEWAIKNGVAKEQARCVLPEGLTMSRMYMTNNMRDWIHYINVRTGIETQKEHKQIAVQCAGALLPIFPMINEFVQDRTF